jgi:transposase
VSDALVRRLDTLEESQKEILERLAAAEAARDHYQQLYVETLARCRKLELGLRGQSAERLRDDDAQLSMSVLGMMLGERAAEELTAEATIEQEVIGHTRRKPTGRKELPEHLPRVEIEIVPQEVKNAGLDAFERIGEEVTEVLERRPASVVVARVIKPKFVRKERDDSGKTKVYVGATPELPIPRCLAGPGMLADTIVKRWQDHLPLNRLEDIYGRDGLELARSTMCGWHEHAAEILSPVVAAMRQDAFEQPVLLTDSTGVLVQAKHKCRTGHFWVLIAPERHVLFEFTRRHDVDAVDDVLAGYEGYLVADAHVVYDHLYRDGNITEVNCWAHCRRYFFRAMSSEPKRARDALGHIGALFKIEKTVADGSIKKRERIRQKHSRPIVERFFSWCDHEWPSLLEDTPLYDGVRYARNQRVGLSRFLEDGRLPLHNNFSELNLRRQAIGRKNWLFVGSDDGARVNAVCTSLLASCRMLGIEPWSYLRDLLCLAPKWPAHAMLALSPINWSTTRERDDVKRALDENPYRRLTLGEPPSAR